MIGLGRMGGNMAERLMRNGHSRRRVRSHARDRSRNTSGSARRRDRPRRRGAKLSSRRGSSGSWCRRASRSTTRSRRCSRIVEGRHHHRRRQLELPRHDAPRQRAARNREFEFIDSGTSGGIWGLENGYCLMVGGSDEALTHCEPIFTALAPEDGYAHVGPSGAGPLREDGAQRHRVRAAAGVRRGLRDPACVEELSKLDLAQIAERVAARQRRALVAQRARGARVREGRAISRAQGLGRRLGRRALDGAGSDRPRRARAGDHALAADAASLAAGRFVRRQGDRRAAQRVRRPRGEGAHDRTTTVVTAVASAQDAARDRATARARRARARW